MTHASLAWAGITRSRRATVGLVILAMLAFLAVFAEVFAAPAPLVSFGPERGLRLFPAILHAAAYEGKTETEVIFEHRDETALWPPVRFGPTTVAEAGAHAPSTGAHPLGTDALGRDVLARLLYGARTALGLSLSSVVLSMFLGVFLGGLSGFSRFWNDRLVRLVETVDTFPAIIVVALVRAIEHQPSALSLVLAIAAVRWAEIARLVRSEVLRTHSEEYVTAARALGASFTRTFFRHMLPNAIGPVIVSSVFGVASVVLLEATISFLAMGTPSQVATWGETLAQGARDPSHLRLVLLPGFLLLLTVGGTYLIADALRDALDPRSVRPGKRGVHSPLIATRGPAEGEVLSRRTFS